MGFSVITFDALLILVLAFSRLYGFMSFFPLISGEQVPAMVRAICCLALTPYVGLPLLGQGLGDGVASQAFFALLFKEGLVGAFMGLVTGLPLRLPEIIGGMIDNQRGSAVTDTYNPTSGSDASLLGQLLSLTMVVYFFTSGGLQQIVMLLGGSFKLLPVEGFVPTTGENAWQVLLEMFIRYLSVFVILTLPVMAAMFLAEMALAVASRFAQSLNVFALAQPVKALVAISMLVTMMPRINREVMDWTQDIMRRFGL